MPLRHLIAGLLLAIGLSLSAAPTQTAVSKSPGQLTSLHLHFAADLDATTNAPLKLHGRDARQQLLVTAKFDSGARRDFTRQVTFTATPAKIVQVDKNGAVTPLADGQAVITAKARTA